METIIKEGLPNTSKSKPVCNYQCPKETIVEKLFYFKSEKKDLWYQTAADLFVILYLTGGMNPVDLLMLKGKNWNGDKIIIGIQNTKDSIIEIVVTEELSTRIMKYANKNITADRYIFPFVDADLEEHDRSKQIHSFVININRHLEEIAEELHMEKFSCYDAKHTWIH